MNRVKTRTMPVFDLLGQKLMWTDTLVLINAPDALVSTGTSQLSYILLQVRVSRPVGCMRRLNHARNMSAVSHVNQSTATES